MLKVYKKIYPLVNKFNYQFSFNPKKEFQNFKRKKTPEKNTPYQEENIKQQTFKEKLIKNRNKKNFQEQIDKQYQKIKQNYQNEKNKKSQDKFQENFEDHYQVFQAFIKEKFYHNNFNNYFKYILAFSSIYILNKIKKSIFPDDYISYQEFIYEYLNRNKISQITVQTFKEEDEQILIIETSDGQKKLIINNLESIIDTIKNQDQKIQIFYQSNISGDQKLKSYISYTEFFIFALSVFVGFTILKRSSKGGQDANNIFNIGKTKAKQFKSEDVKIKFNDVAGQDEAKLEIQEFVDFLKDPEKYEKLGAKIPRGALLTGPPGTGKTLMAKASAGEAGVPFFFTSGSDFVEIFVGTGASRVRDLFKQARDQAPCIVFIDEIDAIGRKRDNKMGGNDERDSTLNQLLVEMDGFNTKENVIIFAATNRKELLDPALLRPGRFDRAIDVTLPDLDGRMKIFLVHLKPLKLDSKITIEQYAKRLATLTPGFSGAEISNLCNEAAIIAVRQNKLEVQVQDFEQATDRVMAGLERKTLIDQDEQRTVAIHESGHAVISWFLEGCNPLVKLTIVPRSKGSLGYAQYLPSEGSLQTKQELLDQICGILAGRCAELEFNQQVTTGAQNDLEKAAKLANAIVSKLGMSENIGYSAFKEEQIIIHSQEQQRLIDIEVQNQDNKDQQTNRCKQLIKKHRNEISNLSEQLILKQTLDLNEIIEILGERPFELKQQFKDFINTKKQILNDQNM